jgi:hypothetical protein
MVAWQFIARERAIKQIRPVGDGLIPGAAVISGCDDTTPFATHHTVPYGTDLLWARSQAINCLATFIPSLRDQLPAALYGASCRCSLSVFNKVSLNRLTAFDGSLPPSCKKRSTFGSRGRRGLGFMMVNCLGKLVAVRSVIPRPASTAAQTLCTLGLLKVI